MNHISPEQQVMHWLTDPDQDDRFIEQLQSVTGIEQEAANLTLDRIKEGDALLRHLIGATILRNAVEFNETYDQVNVDPLTGLLNFAALQKRINTHFASPERRRRSDVSSSSEVALGESAGVFFVDGDGMKALNDMFGHNNVDAGLVQMGRTIREQLRDTDLSARRSGDEFIGVLFDVTAQEFSAIMSRLRSALSSGVNFEVTVNGRRQMVNMTATVQSLYGREVGSASEVISMIDTVDNLVNTAKKDRRQTKPRA